LRVADDESNIEGPVWFAALNGVAEVLENDVVFAGQTFEKGWHVVRGHWFSFQGWLTGSATDRRYVQLADDTMFIVNSMIRVTGVHFTSPFRRFRKAGAGLKRTCLMNDEVYRNVLESA